MTQLGSVSIAYSVPHVTSAITLSRQRQRVSVHDVKYNFLFDVYLPLLDGLLVAISVP
jgi:hypothetical protein